MKFEKLEKQFRALRSVIVWAYVPTLVVLGAVACYAVATGRRVWYFTNDPFTLGHLPFYAGVLSSLANVLWGAGAAVVFDTAPLLPRGRTAFSDGLKFLGTVTWVGYYGRTCRDVLKTYLPRTKQTNTDQGGQKRLYGFFGQGREKGKNPVASQKNPCQFSHLRFGIRQNSLMLLEARIRSRLKAWAAIGVSRGLGRTRTGGRPGKSPPPPPFSKGGMEQSGS